MNKMTENLSRSPLTIDLTDKEGRSARAAIGPDPYWSLSVADPGFDLGSAMFSIPREHEAPLQVSMPQASWLLTPRGLQCMADAFNEGNLLFTLERYLELCGLVSREELVILASNLWNEASPL